MQNDFFHTNLRRARELAGLSQAELADDLGVSRTTIVALESGRTHLFNKTVPLIARRLGISVEKLLCGRSAEDLCDEPSFLERENTLKEEFERQRQALQDKLDEYNIRTKVTLPDNLDG